VNGEAVTKLDTKFLRPNILTVAWTLVWAVITLAILMINREHADKIPHWLASLNNWSVDESVSNVSKATLIAGLLPGLVVIVQANLSPEFRRRAISTLDVPLLDLGHQQAENAPRRPLSGLFERATWTHQKKRFLHGVERGGTGWLWLVLLDIWTIKVAGSILSVLLGATVYFCTKGFASPFLVVAMAALTYVLIIYPMFIRAVLKTVPDKAA
jgi:hypothetical protein